MTDETTQALLPVTQADRDAAASINPQYFNTSTARAANMAETAAIKNGSLDHHENVQAFARHRIAHSRPSQADATSGEEMRLREALETLTKANQEAVELIDEINKRATSRKFWGISQTIHAKLCTIRITLARAALTKGAE